MSTHEEPTEPSPPRRRVPRRRVPWRRWGWWHRQTTTTRRVVRTSLAVAVTLLLSIGFGLFTATADSSLGPHRAQYSITPQHEIVVELGPLGAVLLDSPLPWPLGVSVVVEEIPVELTAVPTSPVTGLAGDFAAYVQMASQPEAVITEAAMMLVRDAVGRTVVAWSFLLVVIAVGRFASRGLLRSEITTAARRRGVLPLAGAVVVSLVAIPAVDVVRDRPPTGTTISSLAGTPLADLRMTGRMAQLIDTYGGYLVDAYDENEAFYGEVRANLAAAYGTDRAALRPPSIPIVSPAPVDPQTAPADGETASADGETQPADGETASADGATTPADDETADGEAAEPTDVDADADVDVDVDAPWDTAVEPADADAATAAALPRSEPVTLLLVSDLHCNVGMAAVIADAARLSGASAVLDAGDTVMSGTSVESYCVNAFAGALPDDLPLVVSTGNHDSVVTADQMADAGYIVLSGDPEEVAGVRLLGDTDPTLTAVGEGTRPERDESIPELGSRLADRACRAAEDDDPIDILLVHNPSAAEETATAGCAGLTVSGHVHRRIGPEVVDLGVRYVSASSGGAAGGLTVGPLNGTAELTVLRYDVGRGEPMDYRVISVDPAGDVTLGRWYRVPTPQPEPDPTPSSGDTSGLAHSSTPRAVHNGDPR